MSQEALNTFWHGKLSHAKSALENNNFAVWLANDVYEAKSLFYEQIWPQIKPESVSFGGSMTIQSSGLYDELKSRNDIQFIDTYDTSVSAEEFVGRRRQSLHSDLFITSTNSLTMEGHLVNLDGFGNRIGGITFGPKHVLLVVGRNKIVPDLESAITRIKEYAAPANAIRLGRNTPCVKSMQCEDCNSPERICNVWTITEKCNPAERVKIILINQDLGY